MKTQVFILIPDSIPPAQIVEFAQARLDRHRINPDGERNSGRFDYFVGALSAAFEDQSAENFLSPQTRFPYNPVLHEFSQGLLQRRQAKWSPSRCHAQTCACSTS